MVGTLHMLRSPLDFGVLQSTGKFRSHPLLSLRYRSNDLDITRYGISTGRRVGSAVIRNRIRRRLRSILRALQPDVRPGWDLLIVARPPAATASQQQLAVVLQDLLSRAGLLTARSGT